MATSQNTNNEQVVPGDNDQQDVLSVQARYLRSPSPSRFSIMSDTDTESIFMEPIHLSSTVAAAKIINEELKPKEIKVEPMSPKMMESAEQLLVEDLYNRVKVKFDDTSKFNTPCIMDIQRALMHKLEAPRELMDEVWPNVFIAEKGATVNKVRLKRLGITHILNAAHGTGVYTKTDFYAGMEIQYLGIEADDFPDFDLSKHFRKAAEFMDEALLTYRGKVLVCSVMGVSRSAALVTAYLMIFHHMTIMEALMMLRKKRPIFPNEGFLMQLRELNENLLDERGQCAFDDDDDETLSQCSVIEAKSCSVSVAKEEAQSIMGAKAHSIMVEEEDTASLIANSLMSSVAKSSIASKRPSLIDEAEEERIYEEWRAKQGMPLKERTKKPREDRSKLPEDFEEANNVDWLVREWQSRNEKFQLDPVWQLEQLSNSEEDRESVIAGSSQYPASKQDDSASVGSLDSDLLQQRLEYLNKPRRTRNDSLSTEASTWDMWDERLLEISKKAARGDDSSSIASFNYGEKRRDPDEENSVLSETSSLFNFCKKNKDNLTPLERWRIKRIQFGWNKKDPKADDENTPDESEEGKKREQISLADVNLTAYQSWKLKHQKKLGNENKNEIINLTKDGDITSERTKQRRAEVLERSKRTLEESKSLSGYETDCSMSGSIPLSIFGCRMSDRSVSDDAASILSMQSSGTSMSRARTASATAVPMPPLQVNADATVSLSSIQDWIASVVNEQIALKQNEIIGAVPIDKSLQQGATARCIDNDKMSLLSMQSGKACAGSLLGPKAVRSTDAQSVLSCSSLSSFKSEGFNSKEKITKTSKPLYSLFADEINFKKLDCKNKEIKSEMKDKMDAYQKEKVVFDNKRSTMFKKKKRDESEDEVLVETNSECFSSSRTDKFDTTSNISDNHSYTCSSIPASPTNIEKWISDIKEVSDNKTFAYDQVMNEDKRLTSNSYLHKAFSESLPKHQLDVTKDSASLCTMKDVDLKMSLTGSEENTSRRFASACRTNVEGNNLTKLKYSTPPPDYSFQRPMTEEPGSSSELHSKTSCIEMKCPYPNVGLLTSDQPATHLFPKRSCLPHAEIGLSTYDDTLESYPKRTFNQSFANTQERGSAKRNNHDLENPTAKKGMKPASGNSSDDDDKIIAAWRNRQEIRMKDKRKCQTE
ncbi:serine/threonine/tyrosine-interacting-like protein 2 isoform X2 [Stegostoma tigrinum]|nr:serine/threonine/tyrosine-interacting-like protein 2 isoform X2 [Stegostoma tigrinum]XP_048396633.1 serine/threonine/tyrosine-interacting-like protein 2 isoform X2 [Stegostoma tigrinum]XP_048396634.1 serine/threonine/tyrosine-interacting-like protein 2 isoform X2 [Stegostoma tigrinum]